MNRIVPPLLLALTLGLGGHAALAAPPATLIGGYADAARAADPAFTAFSATRG